MDQVDDNDLKVQRVLGNNLEELKALLPRSLWKASRNGETHRKPHRRVRLRDLDRILTLIEPFQEDPQLLDTHLKYLLPQLVEACLAHLQLAPANKATFASVPLPLAATRIINIFCKVRGEKVVVDFLSNEPKYLEAILGQLQRAVIPKPASDDPEAEDAAAVAWQERYVLLLWLSHLMLAPFDLSTISTAPSASTTADVPNLTLPSDLPDVVQQLLPLCFTFIRVATKERSAASQLLVRIVLRPDMQKVGLLDGILHWALKFFETSDQDLPDIHQSLGLLTFVDKLVAAASADDIGKYISRIFRSCQNISESDRFSVIRSSAVARKLVIKTQRDILIHCLKSGSSTRNVDVSSALEDVIDHLLQSVADGDTPVRYAASKALSAIALKLDPGLAADVIEAVLGCLGEDVLWKGSERDLSSVNPLRWHGLTLTLAHLLYKKAPATAQLPDVLNALLLALSFEQRSTTGSSIGANVRDAACFGIWALSRRYSTADLLAIDINYIRSANGLQEHVSSLIQFLASELVVSACLDPAGNIRRGSSAALQELIGRHPDTITAGIPLVQIVDFHAVGLRDRALQHVAVRAAQLDCLYWESLFRHLLGWRGIGAVDAQSRISSAQAVSSLSLQRDTNKVGDMITRLVSLLRGLAKREIEERHGVIYAIAALISANVAASADNVGPGAHESSPRLKDELKRLDPWNALDILKGLTEKNFTSTALRPELTATSVCRLITALADLAAACDLRNASTPRTGDLYRCLEHCMRRSDPQVLSLIPTAVRSLAEADPTTCSLWIKAWRTVLQQTSTYTGTRASAAALALGVSNHSMLVNGDLSDTLEECRQTVATLCDRCTDKADIHNRVMALQSLPYIIGDLSILPRKDTFALTNQIGTAILASLNDYTINERGDVGSNVRLEAIKCMQTVWQYDNNGDSLCANEDELHAAVYRLSLEKLDKVRTQAAQCLCDARKDIGPERPRILTAEGASSYNYFKASLESFRMYQNVSKPSSRLPVSLIEGYVSSAGGASESALQASRSALTDFLQQLPIGTNKDEEGTLFQFASRLIGVLSATVSNDRSAVPTLEVIGYLLDAGTFQLLQNSPFPWRSLLSAVQTAHFKSTNMQKLHLVVEIYRGLGEIANIRTLVIKKVISMLIHPYPTVRVAAAETLFLITGDATLKDPDWARTAKTLKPVVETVQANLALK